MHIVDCRDATTARYFATRSRQQTAYTFHSFWRRTGTDILLDLVDVELAVLAPPIIGPYLETVEIGSLPAGVYDLAVRLFWTFVGEETIPDPWDFPNTFGRSFGGNPGPLTLSTSFMVVPEPSSLVLLAAFGATFVGLSQTKRLVRYSIH